MKDAVDQGRLEDLVAARLAGPGYFTCERLQPCRISFHQCRINFQTAGKRQELADWLIGPLRPCLDCPEGAARAAAAPEALELPPPLRSLYRVQMNSPLGKVFEAKRLAAEETPPLIKQEAEKAEVRPKEKRNKVPPGMTRAVAESLGLI